MTQDGEVESQIDASTKKYQLDLLRNIERRIPKTNRTTTPNWVFIKDWLTGFTSKGGSTCAFLHCKWLGIDPDAYSIDE